MNNNKKKNISIYAKSIVRVPFAKWHFCLLGKKRNKWHRSCSIFLWYGERTNALTDALYTPS